MYIYNYNYTPTNTAITITTTTSHTHIYTGLERANATFLEDVAQNADLYIANQSGSV